MTVNDFYLRCTVFAVFLSGIGSTYFSQRKYVFTVDTVSLIVGQVVIINNVTSGQGCMQGTFQLTDRRGDNSNLFVINKSGWISIAGEIDTDTDYILTVRYVCKSNLENSVALVEVLPNESCYHSNTTEPEQLRKMAFSMCFQQENIELYVEENKQPKTLGNLARCQRQTLGDRFMRTYQNFDRSIIEIDNRTTMLRLRRALDRENETSSVLKYNLKCIVHLTDINMSLTSNSQLSIHIGDVNDSPPRLQNEFKEVKARGNQMVDASIFDKDVSSAKDFKIDVIEDPDDLCKVEGLQCFVVKSDSAYTYEYTACRLRLNVSAPVDTSQMENYCRIQIVDDKYISATNKSGKAILNIKILTEDKPTVTQTYQSYRAIISRAASQYAQVHSLPVSSGYTLQEPNDAFRMVPSGIIYVYNISAFTKLESPHNLTIESATGLITLDVTIVDALPVIDKVCNLSCSRYMEEPHCVSACGIGSSTGRCQWRSGSNVSMTAKYSTCVPNLSTCPNGKCDSVEQLNPSICPQDCTMMKVIGEGELNTPLPNSPPMGIKRGTSPCWCDYRTQCSCFRPTSPDMWNRTEVKVINRNNTKRRPQSVSPSLVIENDNSSTGSIPPQSRSRGAPDDNMRCDLNCRTTIAATGGSVGAIICLLFLTWRLRKTRCQKRHTLKHVDSIGSISGMPSDYLDDRDYRTAHPSPHWSPKRSTEYSQCYEDDKWEFPRDKLILEKTLGEGEFGRVVKAKAYGLNGKEGYRDVAVKMLKNVAVSGELQDLLSEYNLLKDVNHSNVIKLLGACTKGGPFYVIVEYCEHGSLLHYLRGARLEENGYVNHKLRRHFRHQTETGEAIETEILNLRNLLSFAWQIAKGMRYLSEIKLVHRDLAARNVLVGSGKVLKISDFGLTRDVYEADTYFKKSKGRIPVKWLAPESLYAQIYTTQSDVWSFGIVLWEIVTLGAPPYPGIPPERLYNLLIAGYRMDRPEGCSDELYAVMQKCWKSEPAARPNFADLGSIFDQMLQQRTEYLEITGGFEDVNPDLFERHFNTSNVTSTGHVNSSSVESSNPYLTPASAADRVMESETNRKSRDVNLQLDVSNNANIKNKGTKPAVNESENVALLLNSRTVVFSNSFDSEDDLNVRQTGAVPVYA